MKKPYLILLFFLFCVHSNQAKQMTFENPIPVKFGDPYILKASDNRYYMVGTGGVKDGFKM